MPDVEVVILADDGVGLEHSSVGLRGDARSLGHDPIEALGDAICYLALQTENGWTPTLLRALSLGVLPIVAPDPALIELTKGLAEIAKSPADLVNRLGEVLLDPDYLRKRRDMVRSQFRFGSPRRPCADHRREGSDHGLDVGAGRRGTAIVARRRGRRHSRRTLFVWQRKADIPERSIRTRCSFSW